MNEKKTGRYPYGTREEIRERMIHCRNDGMTVAEIAKDFGIPESEVRELQKGDEE